MSPDPERQRNSIELQRQTIEAFIASRQHEGWAALPEHYDDMGFTGGNMERPALERLLDDVQQGRIDCIVVYKLDRLTRSLVDFARLVDIFDAHGIGFACATQELDTTNPMGRLALNVLLSFAQFERGIIADRIRDSVRARLRHGEWAIGGAPLGYELHRGNPRLVPNDDEAERVRSIFALYLEHQSTIRVADELNRRGWHSGRRIAANGHMRGGKPFSPSTVSYVLGNPVYIGKVSCRGEIYPGRHQPIVDGRLWRQAQEIALHNKEGGPRSQWNEHAMLLKGLLYCRACGSPMKTRSPETARGRAHYSCAKSARPAGASCRTRWVHAHALDAAVLQHIRAHAAGTRARAAGLRSLKEQTLRCIAELEHRRCRLREALRCLRQASEAPGSASAEIGGPIAEQSAWDLRAQLVSSHWELFEKRTVVKALLIHDPGWALLEPLEQWHALRLLVERIVWDGEAGKGTVFYRGPAVRAQYGPSSEFLVGP
jgi:site-specific DNA recombinase